MKIQNPFRVGLFGGLGVLVAAGIGATVGSLATILTYIGAALFLALGLDPLVTWLEKHRFPRALAIATVLVAVLAVFAGLIFAIIPVITEQVNRAVTTVPALINGFADDTIADNVKTALPWLDVDGITAGIQDWFASLDFTGIGAGVLTLGIGIATGVTGAVVVLILTIYFVSSLTKLKRGLYQLVPASKRPTFIDLSEQVSTAVGRYVIGQGSLALVNGVLSFIVLTVVLPAFGLRSVTRPSSRSSRSSAP